MTIERPLFVVGLAASVGAIPSPAITRKVEATTQQAVFRTRTDAVTVDVAVFAGNRPVTDLTAADFDLTDNAVRQRVEVLSLEEIPLDLTVVLAYQHLPVDVKALSLSLGQLKSRLPTGSRVLLLTVSNELREMANDQSSEAGLGPSYASVHGHMSVQDGLAMAMMRPAPSDRRRVVVLFASSACCRPITPPEGLREIASRFDGVAHVALSQRNDNLRQVAELTGGELHQVQSPSQIGQTVGRVLDAYRRSYVLRYVPDGVARDGWHAIDVKVNRASRTSYTVRSRKGYWLDGGS